MGITSPGEGHSLPAADALACGVPHDLRPGDPRGGAAPAPAGEAAGGATGPPAYRVRGGLRELAAAGMVAEEPSRLGACLAQAGITAPRLLPVPEGV